MSPWLTFEDANRSLEKPVSTSSQTCPSTASTACLMRNWYRRLAKTCSARNEQENLPLPSHQGESLPAQVLRPMTHSLSALFSLSPSPTGGAERMVDTKVTCLLLFLPRKGEERSIKEKAQAVLSQCLLACSSASWETGLSVWGNLCIFTCTGPRALPSHPWSPSSAWFWANSREEGLSKLQGERWPCLSGQVLLMVSVACLSSVILSQLLQEGPTAQEHQAWQVSMVLWGVWSFVPCLC